MMHLLFDGGQVEHGHGIVLQESELDDYRFTAADELADYLPPRGLARLESRAARPGRPGCLVYVPQVADSSGPGLADRARGQAGDAGDLAGAGRA